MISFLYNGELGKCQANHKPNSEFIMAGHSKWANIKHRKARQDQKRGKQWSKCSKAIMAAARQGGGDPDTNLSLRYAIDEAKAVNMPKDTIENAIKKGAGEGDDGVTYESIVYEGYGPAGVAVMCEILTDNRNRTAPEVRKIFEKCNGNLGQSGCVAYIFDNKGQILLSGDVDEEKLMEVAIEAGAEDVRDDEGAWEVVTDPSSFMQVRSALETAGFTFESAAVTMIPNNTVTLSSDDAEKVMRLIDALDDHDDVQKVHSNVEFSEEDLASIEA